MACFFIPRQWRLVRYVWFLIIFEFPFTVANLALFGIASPNLYRTILWNEGGKLGFNSDSSTVVYAYANYRPVTIPVVWSGFNTQYHLVIGVVCMFFYLIKVTMWLLHVFLPIFSILLHIPLLAIWAYGIHIQTSPDTIDPARRNNGAPWYITKNCNIVDDKQIQKYCMQAKSSFAVSCIMLTIYTLFLLISLYSLYPTADQRLAHSARRAEKKAEKEIWASTPDGSNEMTAEEQWQHMWELQQLPRTPGPAEAMDLKTPMTPRTRAFGHLEAAAPRTAADTHASAYARQQHQFSPHPSWVAHAHGQPTYTPGLGQGAGHSWYGGNAAGEHGFVQVQQVSPVAEQEESQFALEGKGKRALGFAH
ncbi:uncharacterized protein EKO05_0004538 [Ascochyta rabiei]|uniref:Uncharacterized protein n=1 Tax=Didymella rabiei TaxID=5454 RepID=A0A162ZAV7_DIDRA|nr:uncharacterized protein EKO05_0004538 [Ascochyta rabiei]KZM20505.1 hypothetical protein ST47_g8374 [Ascochyta rabiei]UPX14046.1 hypothetical protein EKO05_0004538 [Ascochyta rabiei]